MRKTFFPLSEPTFIDKEKIIGEFKAISAEIARKNKRVESVILFGSYANNNAGTRSDADILVVLLKDERKMLDRLDEFMLAFSEGPIPVDVFVYTKDEITKALETNNSFITQALQGIRLV